MRGHLPGESYRKSEEALCNPGCSRLEKPCAEYQLSTSKSLGYMVYYGGHINDIHRQSHGIINRAN